MKRLSVLVSSLFIFLGLFVSCKNDIKTEKKAYLTFGDVSRVIQPTQLSFAEDEEISFELKGKYEESEFSTLRTWSYNEENGTAYNQMIQSNIPVELGKWDFELLAIKNEQPFLKGSIVDKDIVIGENILNFGTMEILKEEGLTGSINFQLNFLFDEIKAVKCGLYDLNSNVAIENFESESLNISSPEEGSRSVCYEKTDVPVGIYFMKFELYSDEKAENRIKVYSPVINVVAGHLTEGEDVLESINTFYTIEYELNGASWRDEYEPETYFNKNALVYLPSSDDLIYEGYNFLGWYIGDEKIESPYCYLEITSSVITLTAHWEENLSVIYSYNLGKQEYASDDGASLVPFAYNSEGVVTEYKANVDDPTNSQTVWDYYVQPANVYFEEGCNYAVSVKLKSKEDTVVGIQAANADMFFTVNGEQEEWTTCTFETGFIEKTPSDEKNGITIGFALAEEIYISSLKISSIEEDDNLPTLAFNVTKTGIENYLNNADRPSNIIEVAKTELNDGYAITINTPLASNNYDSTNTYLYNDVTLELRDYAKNKGINKVAFDFQTSDTVYTSIVADTISPNSMAWNNKRQKNEESISTIFPVFEDGEAVTASIIKISNADVTSLNKTSFSIRNFKIEKIDAYSNKYFAIKTLASTGGDKYTESQSVPVSEAITIPGNNASKEFDVLMYNKNDSGIDWDEVTRFIYSTEEKTISSLRYYIGDDGKYYIQNTGSSEISCKITLTEDFTVQIEETTTGGTTGEGATITDPSEQKNGLAYFTKSDGNGGNISCLYIYDDVGLGLYRDLVNGTLKSELTFTKNGYTIGSIPPSYTGRVDAYLAENIEITNAWTPIGTSSNSFTSSFDGQGHSITINSCADGEYAGVFGYVGNQSASTTSISNLVVKGPDAGITTSAQYAGGIVAYSYGATISNCVNKLKILNTNSDSGVGGIVGIVEKPTVISGCVNFIDLVNACVGGIVGIVLDGNVNNEDELTVTKCINLGKIQSQITNAYLSGGVGKSYGSVTITDCINLGEIGWLTSANANNNSGFANVMNNGSLNISTCINAGPYPKTTNNSLYAIAYGGEIVFGGKLYYNSDKWKYTNIVSGNEDSYTPSENSSSIVVEGKSTSELCALTTTELSDNWSCVIDGTRYPLPDILGADENSGVSQSIWEEICKVAKVEVSSGGGEDEIIQNAYYVSAIGSDANDGKTTDTSFATLEHALSKITDEYRTIYIVGTYYGQSDATYSATWIDTSVGTQESPIQIIGYPDSNPELSQDGEKRVLYISDDSYLILKNISIVGGNTRQTGGAICFDADGQLTLENCTLSGNESTSGINGFDSLYHNGITLSGNSSLIVKNSVIENNIVLDSASADSTSVTFTGSSEIKGNVILNSDSTNIILENDITVSGTIYIATGIIPEPAITITSALTKHSSDNKISVSYQDFTKALNTQCISLKEGVSSDELSKFILTNENYVISTDGKISTNN